MSAAVNSSSHADTDERHFESHKKKGKARKSNKNPQTGLEEGKKIKGEQVRRDTHSSLVSHWPLSSNREVGLVSCKSTCVYIGLSGAKRCVQFSSRHIYSSAVYIVRVMWLLTDGDQAQMYDVRTGARMASASACDDLLPPDWQ